MSSEKVGEVLKLFTSKSGTSQRFEQSSLSLDEFGVKEDKFYNKSPERSVLISSTDSYNLIKTYGITMPFGYLGENILMDFNPYNLTIGSRLKIGTCILEISQNCTICNHLALLDVKIPTLLKNDRGIFAKVIQAGKISTNDNIEVI